MSLINNMLNALEENKKEESNDNSVLSSIRPITKKQKGFSKGRLIFWIVFLAAVGSAILYYNPKTTTELKQFITNIKTKNNTTQKLNQTNLDNTEIAPQSTPELSQPLTILQYISVA